MSLCPCFAGPTPIRVSCRALLLCSRGTAARRAVVLPNAAVSLQTLGADMASTIRSQQTRDLPHAGAAASAESRIKAREAPRRAKPRSRTLARAYQTPNTEQTQSSALTFSIQTRTYNDFISRTMELVHTGYVCKAMQSELCQTLALNRPKAAHSPSAYI